MTLETPRGSVETTEGIGHELTFVRQDEELFVEYQHRGPDTRIINATPANDRAIDLRNHVQETLPVADNEKTIKDFWGGLSNKRWNMYQGLY